MNGHAIDKFLTLSNPDLINKLKIVEEEADETLYWLERLVEAELLSATRLTNLMDETDQIIAMTVASLKTLRLNTKSNHKRKS